MNTITAIVPVYRNDFDAMRRLLTSMAEYWQRDQLEEVIVILNEKYSYRAEFDSIIAGCQEVMPGKIRSIWANELHTEMEQYDWYSQQFLKILVAEQVKTEWYIIHDAKDYYIGHCDLTHWFDEAGRAHGCVNPYDPVNHNSGPGIFDAEYTRAYRLWNMDFRNYKGYMLKYITPFLVRTETMRDMTADLKEKFQTLFYQLLYLQINHKPAFTEFALISAYITYRGQLQRDYTHGAHSKDMWHYRVKQSKDLRRKF